MGCPAKPKKSFLFIFDYDQPHDWEIYAIRRHIKGVSDTWIIREECAACGCRRKRHFIKDEDLLRRGFTIEKLREIDNDYFASWHRNRDGKLTDE